MLLAMLDLGAQNLFPGDSSFEFGTNRFLGGKQIVFDGKNMLELSRAYNHSDIYYDIIKADKEYVFCFMARSPQPVMLTVTIYHVLYGNLLAPQTFELGPGLRQYVIKIPKQPKDRDIYFGFALPTGSTAQIDDLMLNEGATPEAYANAKPFQTLIEPTGAPGNIVLASDALKPVKIGAGNFGTEAKAGKLELATFDFYGQKVSAKTVDLDLAPGKTVTVDFNYLPQLKKGYYIIDAKLIGNDGKVLAADAMPVGVVPDPLKIAPAQSSFGTHSDSSRIENAALPRIGVKWVRSMPGWNWMEKSPGVYTFSMDDLKNLGDNGIAVYYGLKIIEHLPPFYRLPDGKLKDPEALRNFINALSKAVPANVLAWEIENEPDLGYPDKLKLNYLDSAAYYGEIVGLAGKMFHEARPDMPVGAMSVSGGSADSTFVNAANVKGGKDYDIMAPHPYIGSRYLGPKLPAVAPDSYIRERMIDKAKVRGDKKLWAGEIGWGFDRRESLDSETLRTYSNYIARALILIKSVPEVDKIMWFKAQGCYERDYYQYGLWRSEFEPLAATVFYANIANRLEGAKPLPPVFEADLRVYPFTGSDGKVFAAVWRSKGSVREIALNAKSEDLTVTDIFGNPVKLEVKDGKSVIPVSETPLWIEAKGDLVALLKDVDIDMVPFSVTFFMDNGKQLFGMLKNNLPKKLDVTVSAPGVAKQSMSLQPGAAKSLALTFDKGIGPNTVINFATSSGDVKIEYDQSNFLKSPQTADPAKIGAKPTVLAERKYIYPPDPNIGWNSPADLSAAFETAYDDKYFYFSVDVTDPVHFQKSEVYRAWGGDSLQLAIDTMNDAPEGVFEFNQNDVEFIAWLGPKGPMVAKTYSSQKDMGQLLTDVKVEIKHENGHTKYFLAIPWSQLEQLKPQKGRIFGLNFIINQNNGQGRRYWLGLTEGIGETKYPFIYRKFKLE